MQDDVELVRRMQRGDLAAADQFVRRHEARLGRLALLWSDTPDDARDAVQEAMARGLSGIAAFRFRSRPFTWLAGTLRNVCGEMRREARRGPNRLDPDDVRETPGERPFEDLAGARDSGQVLRLLDALSPRQRDAVVLRVLEELSVRDTAAVMGCREGTVKALLHQGLARLRTLASASDAEEGSIPWTTD